MIKKLLGIIAALTIFYFAIPAFAYEDKITHPDLTEFAIGKSVLNKFLKENLGVPEGLDKEYKQNKSIEKLLQGGSTNEDVSFRAENHFWNPIHNEGLDDLGAKYIPIIGYQQLYFTGLPNRDWAMGEAQDGTRLDDCGVGDYFKDNDCNDYSWKRARETFHEALLGTTEKIRDEKFAEIYEKLGRVLHLLQDTGVPAHTRNDMFGHLDFAKIEGPNPKRWVGNLYEFWVKWNRDLIENFSQNAKEAIFQRPEEFWDREVYFGAFPNLTMPVDEQEQAGLAEYSNANFLSKCTIFTEDYPYGDRHYFPFPKKTSVKEMPPLEITAEWSI